MNPSQIYRRLAELPVFTSASFISSSHVIVESSVRDHLNNTKRTFVQDIGIHGQGSKANFWLSNPSERAESIVARLVSASGKRVAILKETNGTPKKRFVEIWKGDRAELILETTSKHGSFYGDATFSSLCFSPNENALLYTAEANPLEEEAKDPFHKFQYEQQFGETFIDRRRPTLFWLRWSKAAPSGPSSLATSQLLKITPAIERLGEKSEEVDNPPVFSLGQATFTSQSGRSIIATAYFRAAGDRKLGIVYCTNRPSSIVRFTLPDIPLPDPDAVDGDKKVEEKSPEEKKKSEEALVRCRHIYSERPCRSPRVWLPPAGSNDHSKIGTLVFLSSEKGPHGSCSQLHMMKIPLKAELEAKDGWEGEEENVEKEDDKPAKYDIRTVVDTVGDPSEPVSQGGFPGLYINQLPPNPFLLIDETLHVVAVSSWGSHQTLVAVPLRGEKVLRLSGPKGLDNGGLVNCDGGSTIVGAFSSMTTPNELFYATVNHNSLEHPGWKQMTRIGEPVADMLSELHSEVIEVRGSEPVETIYLGTKQSKVRPLITMPHGGPHAATQCTFSAEGAAIALAGYSMSFPNYRGSLGYGQKWVDALLGKIGRLDVDDVMASTKEVIKRGLAEEGPGMQLYMGGSHGGFLGAHVIGQFPDFFSACVLRNPVINVASMIFTTDIPDWCSYEAGIPYNSGALPTADFYSTLYAMSPIQYTDKVKTPVLLRMGDVDQRVPPSQGKEYYHLLKARGMGDKVKMLWFPENGHPLDKVEAERAGWDASLAWFRRFGAVKDD